MELFTIVLDWLDLETLMWQGEGACAKSAVEKWASEVSLSEVPGLSAEGLLELQKELKAEDAAPIRGWSNTWCMAPLVGDELALFHIVQTVR